MTISADGIYNHLTGHLTGDELMDQAGEETLAILHHQPDGLIRAYVPDVYPRQTIGRFRVTVEEVTE